MIDTMMVVYEVAMVVQVGWVKPIKTPTEHPGDIEKQSELFEPESARHTVSLKLS